MLKRPNIILISLDAVRADHLFCYGYPRKTMPELDKFAQESVLFESAYSPACWTIPAHASMLTGTSNSKHGIATDASSPQTLSDFRLTTLAEYLQKVGYQTVGFSGSVALSRNTFFHRGFDAFFEPWELISRGQTLGMMLSTISAAFKKDWVWRINWLYERHIFRRWDKGAKKTRKLLANWLEKSLKVGQPFFAFIHLFEAHAPYWPPKPYRSVFIEQKPSSKEFANRFSTPWKYYDGSTEIEPQEFQSLVDLYDAELFYLDAQVQGILDQFDERGLIRDTVIIITADHGECFGEHGFFQHAPYCLYEPLVHVPLIIKYPGTFPPGSRISQPVSTYDLFPTIVNLCGGEALDLGTQLQGVSLVPEALETHSDRVIISEAIHPLGVKTDDEKPIDAGKFDYNLRAVLWRNYKYIWHSKGKHELYDLQTDPDENTNLVQSHPDLVRHMQKKLDEWLTSFRPYSSPMHEPIHDRLSPEVVERLQALGYIDLIR